MNGVNFALNNGRLDIVASDSHALVKSSKAEQVAPNRCGSFVMPKKAAKVLTDILEDEDWFEMEWNEREAHFNLTGSEFSFRLIEGKYPDYNSVIPKNSPYHATLPVAALAGAVKRVQLMASDASNMVKLSKEGMFLNLSAEDYDFSKTASENLVLAEVDNPLTIPDGFAIGFKASSLLMLLGNISTDNVTLQLSEPSRSILVLEDAPNSALVELLMPMQLNA
jgi:DNA polymerase-3 subunit beta